jgi:hypothetical protein
LRILRIKQWLKAKNGNVSSNNCAGRVSPRILR